MAVKKKTIKRLSTKKKLDTLNKVKKFVKSKDFGPGLYTFADGLCDVIDTLKYNKEITTAQRNYFKKILDIEIKKVATSTGSVKWNTYVWPAGSKPERLKFVNKLIKELKNGKSKKSK